MKLRDTSRVWLCWAGLALAACRGDGSSPVGADDAGSPDGSSAERDAAPPDSGALDGGQPDGGSPLACLPGDSVRGSFGPGGGSVSLCGATVSLAAGLLEAERSVTLAVVELPGALPFLREVGGLAFDVELEGGVPSAAEPPLSVLLPHAETTHYVYFYRHDDTEGFQEIEACIAEPTRIGQDMYVDGTFVALIDRAEFTSASQDLGSGSLATSFDGIDASFDLGSENFDTYAIYDEQPDGGRIVTLAATRPEGEDTRRMKITFSVTAAGVATPIEVSYGLLLEGLWGYLPFDPGSATITLDTHQLERLAGDFAIEIRMAETTGLLTGNFDASPELYRYPPSLSCGSPPEG